jgi:hypothetical protein
MQHHALLKLILIIPNYRASYVELNSLIVHSATKISAYLAYLIIIRQKKISVSTPIIVLLELMQTVLLKNAKHAISKIVIFAIITFVHNAIKIYF